MWLHRHIDQSYLDSTRGTKSKHIQNNNKNPVEHTPHMICRSSSSETPTSLLDVFQKFYYHKIKIYQKTESESEK